MWNPDHDKCWLRFELTAPSPTWQYNQSDHWVSMNGFEIALNWNDDTPFFALISLPLFFKCEEFDSFHVFASAMSCWFLGGLLLFNREWGCIKHAWMNATGNPSGGNVLRPISLNSRGILLYDELRIGRVKSVSFPYKYNDERGIILRDERVMNQADNVQVLVLVVRWKWCGSPSIHGFLVSRPYANSRRRWACQQDG